MADALHALSEGYGFVLLSNLQLMKTETHISPILRLIKCLRIWRQEMAFWDRTSAELNAMADQIDAASGLSTK